MKSACGVRKVTVLLLDSVKFIGIRKIFFKMNYALKIIKKR